MAEEAQQAPLAPAEPAAITPGSQKRPAEEHEGLDGSAKSPRLADSLPDSLPGTADGPAPPGAGLPAGPGAEAGRLEALQQQLAEALAEGARWREECEEQRRQLDAALRKVALLEGLVGGSEEANAKLAALGEGGAAAAAAQQQFNGVAVAEAEAKARLLQKQLDDAKQQMEMLRQAAKGHVQKIAQYELQLKQVLGDGTRQAAAQRQRQFDMGHRSPAPGGVMMPGPYGGPPPPPQRPQHAMPPPPGMPHGGGGGAYPPPSGAGGWPAQQHQQHAQHAQHGYYGPAQQPPAPGPGGAGQAGYYDAWGQYQQQQQQQQQHVQQHQQPQPAPAAAAQGTGDYWSTAYQQGAVGAAPGAAAVAAAPQGAQAQAHAPYYTQPQGAAPVAADPYAAQAISGSGAYQAAAGAAAPAAAAAAATGPQSGGSAGAGGGRGADVDVDAIWWELDPRKRDVIERFARSYPMMVDPSQAKEMCITDFRDMTEAQLEGFFMWLAGHCNPSKQLRFPGGFIRVKHTEWKRLFMT